MLLGVSLTIKYKQLLVQTCHQSHVSVSLSGEYTVAKWLIRSGCRLGCSGVSQVMVY